MPLDATVDIPDILVPIFEPERGAVDYRAARGGRGSAKSYNFALMATVFGYGTGLRILCTREYQSSIRESFHAELRGAIESRPFLAAHYDIGVDYIRGKCGTEFMFKGLRYSMSSIKSTAHIDLTIIEEAEDVPETAWESLLPTVMRTPKSEVWVIWNSRLRGSPVDKRFVQQPMPRSLVAKVNHSDNPFFPKSLDRLRLSDKERLDDATYQWIWEGEYYERSKAQVFADKFVVKNFEPTADWHGPYQGGDLGFSVDPTAAVRCWIYGESLYIEYEAGSVGLELDDTAKFVNNRIPRFDQYITRWDNARPESISYFKRHGLPKSVGVHKWPGSVEDGIQFMRAFKQIVVHPRCVMVADEMRGYSYKTDSLTGDVLPILVDAMNHYIDAIRYALAPIIRKRSAPSVRSL